MLNSKKRWIYGVKMDDEFKELKETLRGIIGFYKKGVSSGISSEILAGEEVDNFANRLQSLERELKKKYGEKEH